MLPLPAPCILRYFCSPCQLLWLPLLVLLFHPLLLIRHLLLSAGWLIIMFLTLRFSSCTILFNIILKRIDDNRLAGITPHVYTKCPDCASLNFYFCLGILEVYSIKYSFIFLYFLGFLSSSSTCIIFILSAASNALLSMNIVCNSFIPKVSAICASPCVQR